MDQKFDEFIAQTESEAEIDTSSRYTTGSISPQFASPTKFKNVLPHETDTQTGQRNRVAEHQHVPKSLLNASVEESHNHPLKEDKSESRQRQVSVSNSNPSSKGMVNKRRSLIQPMMVPTTPETDRTRPQSQSNVASGNSANKNNLHPDTNHGIDINATTQTPSSMSMGNPKFSENFASLAPSSKRNSMHSRTSSSQSMAIDSSLGGSMDVNALLQSLANKELELLECKRKIDDLKKQLHMEENIYQNKANELQELKNKVSKNINVSGSNQPVFNKTSTTGRKNSRESSRRNTHVTPVKTTRNDIRQDTSLNQDMENSDDNKQSMWSKPLALFNQVDQIIQQELERTLNWDEPPTPVAETEENQEGDKSVSKSLWSFVSDLKTGLLGIEEEEDGHHTQQSNSNVNRPKNTHGQVMDNRRHANEDINLSIKEFKTTKKHLDDNSDTHLKQRSGRTAVRKTKSGNKLNFVDDSDDGDSTLEADMVEMGSFSR